MINNKSKFRRLVYAAFIIFWMTAPLYLKKYYIDVLNNVALYAVLGLSLNIILGYGGMFHMGHAAFYAIGAYTTAIINIKPSMPPWYRATSRQAAPASACAQRFPKTRSRTWSRVRPPSAGGSPSVDRRLRSDSALHRGHSRAAPRWCPPR